MNLLKENKEFNPIWIKLLILKTPMQNRQTKTNKLLKEKQINPNNRYKRNWIPWIHYLKKMQKLQI